MSTINPLEDGVTHINLYSKGNTELGRQMTNFYLSPFDHPTFGRFASVEAAWHWLLTGCKHDVLRDAYGLNAKKRARCFVEDKVNVNRELTSLEKKILCDFIKCKIDQNKKIKNNLISSTLPLAHYYYFGKIDNCKVVELPQYDWMIKYIESYRLWLQHITLLPLGN